VLGIIVKQIHTHRFVHYLLSSVIDVFQFDISKSNLVTLWGILDSLKCFLFHTTEKLSLSLKLIKRELNLQLSIIYLIIQKSYFDILKINLVHLLGILESCECLLFYATDRLNLAVKLIKKENNLQLSIS
jgi:hypothetical protein